MSSLKESRFFTGRNRVLAVTIGLSPIWLLGWAGLSSPTFFGGALPTQATTFAGVLAEVVLYAIFGLLTLAGTVAIWRARSGTVVYGAVVLLTTPAMILGILAPALVIILANLSW